jgi:hypothetical protein
MSDGLLDSARRQAEQADPSVRAAALLRIARAESGKDLSGARQTLPEAMSHVQQLPNPDREYLFEEACWVAAAVAPDLLAEIPINRSGHLHQFAAGKVVHTMLQHGHIGAAFDYLLKHDDPASFPFGYIANVLQHFDSSDPESAARRVTLLRRGIEVWRASPNTRHNHQRDHFPRVFGNFWKELPADEALAFVHEAVEQSLAEADEGGRAGYMDEVHFSSPRQHHIFEVFHILRHLEPGLAQSLLETNDQLAAAVRRYPNGLETMNEQIAAEAERRKAAGATGEGGGGYIMTGDGRDFERQRALIDSTRRGDFAPSIEDALDRYRENTSADTRNHAPKESWPSTGRFRTILYQAGKRLGPAAAELLDQIPDQDLRLFAVIELSAALSGVPEATVMQRQQPNPPGAPVRRVAGSRSSPRFQPDPTAGPTMRSPDGRLIRCPKCLFRPPLDLRWGCKCNHRWNTFWTSGRCPACHFQWEETACPQCGERSAHQAWYVKGSD